MTALTGLLARPQFASRIVPALTAILFGSALFIATGFAAPSFLHNATHDTRHAFGLPCH
jgi:cobalt transporter subunit CbtB